MRKNIVCGLDIGTDKLRLSCARRLPDGGIDILGTAELAAQGVESGRIVDIDKASACIKELTRRLHKECGIRVKRAYVNIDNSDLKAKLCEHKIAFDGNLKIEKSHIENLIKTAVSANNSLNRKVIHAGLRSFILDGREVTHSPEGRNAQDIQARMVLVSALIPAVNNLFRCFRQAGVTLAGMLPSPCAQAQVLFSQPSDRDQLLIDTGAALTRIFLFKQGFLKDLAVLSLGGQSITRKLARQLKISFPCAERLKVSYGRTDCTKRVFTEKIIVRDGAVHSVIQPEKLCEIITAQVDVILEEIKKALWTLDHETCENPEITFTGGGAILDGFLERAEKILERPVKMGFLSNVGDRDIQARSALYATSVGLLYSGSNCDRVDLSGLIFRRKINPLKRLIKRAQELCNEYF